MLKDRVTLSLAAVLFVMTLGVHIANAQEYQHTQRLYNQVVFEIYVPGVIFDDTNRVTNKLTGTFWTTEVDGEKVLITAAHNLGRGPNSIPQQIGSYKLEDGTKLLSIATSPVLGTMGYHVRDVGFLGRDNDIVLMRPDDSELFHGYETVKLTAKIPKVGQTVTVFGYPSTSFEKSMTSKVSAVNSEAGFIILNDALDHGYSGGVVINENNQAIGLIITTEAKQSTALLLNKERLAKVEWKALKDIEPQKITSAP